MFISPFCGGKCATETGTESAGHVRFQRNLAGDTGLEAFVSDDPHHRHRTADINHVYPGEDIIKKFSNKSVMSECPVIGSGVDRITEFHKLFGELEKLAEEFVELG